VAGECQTFGPIRSFDTRCEPDSSAAADLPEAVTVTDVLLVIDTMVVSR
jgi:hypothetical protein